MDHAGGDRRRARRRRDGVADLRAADHQRRYARGRVRADPARRDRWVLDRRRLRRHLSLRASRLLPRRRVARSVSRRRRPQCRQRVDARWRRRAAADPDRQSSGLRVCGRVRPAGADGVDRGRLVTRLPILSIITWSPFVAALIIMAVARHRPMLVRSTAVLGAAVPLVLSVWLYYAYDRSAAGFQFAESFPLVPSFGI